MTDYDATMRELQGKMCSTNQENLELRSTVEKLKVRSVFYERKARTMLVATVRSLMILKYLIRIGSLVGVYFWLGWGPCLALGGFIVVGMSIQTGIDAAKCSLYPEAVRGEWDC